MWQEQGSTTPVELGRRLQAPTVFVGVGNELRGDDGAGVLAARRLEAALSGEQKSRGLAVVEAGPVPENYLGPILHGRPHQVVFCDAVDFGGVPGEWRLFEMSELPGVSLSTHNSSLALLGRVLAAEGVSDIFLVGIQPKQTSFGSRCSREVVAAVEQIVGTLLAWVACAERVSACGLGQ